jgi:glucose-6-phosphate 1-dehydrogenase
MSQPVHTYDVNSLAMAPVKPHVVVLFGATGDLSKRKLLPGMLHLFQAGLLPSCRIIGTSLEELNDVDFAELARKACESFSSHPVDDDQWDEFAAMLSYVGQERGPAALAAAVHRADEELGDEPRRLHYLSVPPKAAIPVVNFLDEADLVERSRIVMEKPFGIDMESAVALNAELHETFAEEQIFRIDHFLGKEAAQNILAFRFANGLFEPIWNRNHIDHVQIDVPRCWPWTVAPASTSTPGPTRTWWSPTCSRCWRSWRWSRPRRSAPRRSGRRRTRCSARCGRSSRARGPRAVPRLPRRAGRRAGLRHRDVRRAAGRDRQLALGRRAVLPAHRQAPGRGRPDHLDRVQGAAAQHVPGRLRRRRARPDHLTFDLAEASKLSLSFYGKRPGTGMRLDKMSLQFAMEETGKGGLVWRPTSG